MNKPCPFCGHTETRTTEWMDEDGEFDAIECAKCKGAAPATIWNSRNNTALTKRLLEARQECSDPSDYPEYYDGRRDAFTEVLDLVR
jgi:hypothetical protein